MQIKPQAFAAFCQSTPKAYKSALFYGEESFLTYQKVQQFVQTALKESYKEARFLPADTFAKGNRFLRDELASPGLWQNPVLILQGAQDSLAPVIKSAIEEGASSFFIVVAEEYLKPASKLRKLFEEQTQLAAVACYLPNASDLVGDTLKYCADRGKPIQRDAAVAVANAMVDAPTLLQVELDKVITYVKDRPQITKADVEAILIDYQQTEMDDLAESILQRKPADIVHRFYDITRQGVNEILFLRGFSHKVVRLQQAHAFRDEGLRPEEFSKKLWPPVFGPEVNKLQGYLNVWPMPLLRESLSLLLEAELYAKENSQTATPFVLQTLLKIAGLGK